MAETINVVVGPDQRAWQATWDKLGQATAKYTKSLGDIAGGGWERDPKTGDPMQNVGQQMGKLARMMPAGGFFADIGKAFKQGGIMTGMVAGIVSIVGFFRSAMSQSKIFSTVSQTFMKIVGVMIDMMLMPLLPLFMRFLQWWMTKGMSWATDMGQKIKWVADKLGAIWGALDKHLPMLKIVQGAVVAWFAMWAINKAMGGIGKVGKLIGKTRMGRRAIGKVFGKTAMRASAGKVGRFGVLRAAGGGAVRGVGAVGRTGGRALSGIGGLFRRIRGPKTFIDKAGKRQFAKGSGRTGFAGKSMMDKVKGRFGGLRGGLGSLRKRVAGIGGGRVGRIAAKIGTKQGLKSIARIGTSFVAKRGSSMMAGAMIGGTVGLAGAGVGAIPGALIGAVAGLVIGQATGAAIDVATGQELSMKRNLIPFMAEAQDIQKAFGDDQVDIMEKNNKEVGAEASVLTQRLQRDVTENTNKLIKNSSIPETMDSYIGVYKKMEKEAALAAEEAEGESKGILGRIGDFFSGWGSKISETWNAAWDKVVGWWSGMFTSTPDDPDTTDIDESKASFISEIWGEWDADTQPRGIRGWIWDHSVGYLYAFTDAVKGLWGNPDVTTEEADVTAEKASFISKIWGEWDADTQPRGIRGWAYDHTLGYFFAFIDKVKGLFGGGDEEESAVGEKEKTDIENEKNSFLGSIIGNWSGGGGGLLGWAYDGTVGRIKKIVTGVTDMWAMATGGETSSDYKTRLEEWQKEYDAAYMRFIMGNEDGYMGEFEAQTRALAEVGAKPVQGAGPGEEGGREQEDIEEAKGGFRRDIIGYWDDRGHGILGWAYDNTVGRFNRMIAKIQEKLAGWGFGEITEGEVGEATEFKFDLMGGIQGIWNNVVGAYNKFVEGLAGWTFTLPSIDVDIGGGDIPGSFGRLQWPRYTGTIGGTTHQPFEFLTIDPNTMGFTGEAQNVTSGVSDTKVIPSNYDPETSSASFSTNGGGGGGNNSSTTVSTSGDASTAVIKPKSGLIVTQQEDDDASTFFDAKAKADAEAKAKAEQLAADIAAANAAAAAKAKQEAEVQAKLDAQKAKDIAAMEAKAKADAEAKAKLEAEKEAASSSSSDPMYDLHSHFSKTYGGVYTGGYYWNTGGKVPGVKGAPQLGVLHGGETVLPTHLGQGWTDSTKGGSALQRQLGGLANGSGTVNMMNKPTTINIYTSENAAATIDNIERMQLMDEASFFTSI